MKPRNKFEKAVLAQAKKLRPISLKQKNWAYRECVSHYAYRLPKGRTTCMDCGHSWIMNEEKKSCTCPKCGAKLEVTLTYCRKLQQKQYFTVLTTSGNYQILRMFLLIVEMEKGYKAEPYALEIGQYWWDEKGRKAIVGIQRVLGHYIDTFSFCSPMAIRQDNEAYQHIAYSPIYPDYKSLDVLKRNGFNDDFHDIVPTKLIPALLSDPKAETLLKTGQFPMLKYYLQTSFDMERYWASIKICIRNRYIIDDGSIWRDTVDLLCHFGKDINSPKYVCSDNLKAEHDHYMKKKREQQEMERIRQQRIKALEDEERFKTLKGKFFGIQFTDGEIQVRVLESVEEHLLEGTLMHHCVYDCNYHLREDSLILSATIGGKRIETIEINLKTLEVVQSRGVCNQNTEYHKRIIALVNKNRRLISNRMAA